MSRNVWWYGALFRTRIKSSPRLSGKFQKFSHHRKGKFENKILFVYFFFEIFKSENFRINLRIWHIIIILSLLYIHIHRHIHMKLTTRTSSQIWPESWFQKFEKFTEKDILTAKDPILKSNNTSIEASKMV